jgi:putative membrane protein
MTRIRSTSAMLAMAVAVTASAGLQASQSQPPSSAASAQREARPSDAREFVTQLTLAGKTEVELGKIASERASSADVKAFGQMMVKDHSAAGKDLAQVASQLNIQQPAELDATHRELVERLSKLQGAEFDREYMAAMVKGHEDVVSKLQARAGNRLTSSEPAGKPTAEGGAAVGTTGDADAALAKWAAKTLPTTQRHLERAREIQGKLK